MKYLLAFGIFLAACQSSNSLFFGEVEAEVGSHPVKVTDCYRTKVNRPVVVAQATFRFTPCRDADVLIRDGELIVNGKSYGRIAVTDAVLVDHGRVSIHPRR